MPRVTRQWVVLRAEIRRLLRDSVAGNYYWTDADLLDLWNQCLDLRCIDLMLADEGWLSESQTFSLVPNQADYTPAAGVSRIKRVVLSLDNGKINVALTRDELIGKSVYNFASIPSTSYFPTVRVFGAALRLSPPPTVTVTNGLIVEYEAAPLRFTLDTDTLPSGLPTDIMETVLVYDTAVAALDVEDSQGPVSDQRSVSLHRMQSKLDARFNEHIQDRLQSRVFGTPYSLGD